MQDIHNIYKVPSRGRILKGLKNHESQGDSPIL